MKPPTRHTRVPTATVDADQPPRPAAEGGAEPPARPAAERQSGVLGLISEERLAAELDRTPTTLRRWRKQGIGPPFVPIGRDIWYRPAAVEAWLIAKEQGSPPAGNKKRPGRSR